MANAAAFSSEAACTCETSRVTISGKPLARFRCHCTICQKVYHAAFADVSVFWSNAASPVDPMTINYKRYRLPPAIRRGTCSSCGQPIHALLRVLPFVQIAFIPTRTIKNTNGLPGVEADIFYDSRNGDVEDSPHTYSGYWASEMAATRMILAGAMR